MSDRAIIEAIQTITGTQLTDKVLSLEATVDSVDEKTRTCNVTAVSGKSEISIPDVRLMASVDDGMLLIPVIDSNVTVIVSTYGDPYISSFSELERIIFMGGDLGGLVKLLPLLEKINNIEKDINILKNIFANWTPIAGDGGLALKTAATAWTGQRITETLRKDIENTNITQG